MKAYDIAWNYDGKPFRAKFQFVPENPDTMQAKRIVVFDFEPDLPMFQGGWYFMYNPIAKRYEFTEEPSLPDIDAKIFQAIFDVASREKIPLH